jgi:hypothetical protein
MIRDLTLVLKWPSALKQRATRQPGSRKSGFGNGVNLQLLSPLRPVVLVGHDGNPLIELLRNTLTYERTF